MILRFFSLRELRKFPFFFSLVIFTILLGTIGLTGISVVSQEVREKLKSRSHELLTSDFAVSARRELLPEELKVLKEEINRPDSKSYKIVDIYSMVTHLKSEQSRLVEIRAIEEGFPFHGEIFQREGSFSSDGVRISKDLESLWHINQGDELQIGEIKAEIQGIVDEDSSLGLRGFSLAPRIYVPLKTLEQSGLLKPGATGSFAHHYRLPNLSEEDLKKLKSSLYKRITDPAVRVVLPEDSSQQTARVITILSNFMSLSALIGLILSLVGIFYLYQSHLLARLKDLCLLNLHGLPKQSIIWGIIAQFSFIFLLVFLLQILILIPTYSYLLPTLSESVGMELSGALSLGSIAGQLPFLYILALSILTPLLLGLMRTPMGLMLKASQISMGSFRFYDFIPFVLLLWAFSCYLSNSFKVGNIFFGCLLLVFILSTSLVRSLQWMIRRFIKGRGLLLPTLEAGVALRNLSRSGHKLTLSFLSLAMGATLISLILQLDRMIQSEFSPTDSKPGLFIFDIQDEQMESLVDFAKSNQTPLDAVTPMIRARLELVNGEKFVRKGSSMKLRDPDDREARERNNALNLTSRAYLSPAERILEGEPFPRESGERDYALVSLEKRWADRMDLELGDKVTFDVQGVPLEGKIHNIREVKWTSFYPNFFVNVEPGFLEGAPKTYLAILPSGHKDQKVDFQRKAVSEFPNISFIDVEELVGKLSSLFEKSQRAIQFISFLSLGVGLVILYGLSHDQVYRRYYDLALMKSLGLSSERLRFNLIIEFGSLFGMAMGLGLFLGWLIAQLIGKEVFKLPFGVDWMRIFVPALVLSVLCLATILISSWRVVRAKPRELLSDS